MELGQSIMNFMKNPMKGGNVVQSNRLKLDQSILKKDKTLVGQTLLSMDPAKVLTLGISLDMQEKIQRKLEKINVSNAKSKLDEVYKLLMDGTGQLPTQCEGISVPDTLVENIQAEVASKFNSLQPDTIRKIFKHFEKKIEYADASVQITTENMNEFLFEQNNDLRTQVRKKQKDIDKLSNDIKLLHTQVADLNKQQSINFRIIRE